MGILELDATVCYDRIIKTEGVRGLMIFGIGHHAAQCFLTSVDALRFKITLNGKLEKEQFPDKDESHEGSVQGITGAGGTWNGTDSAITKENNKNAYPAIRASPTKDVTVKKVSRPFVDDRTLHTNGVNGAEIRHKIKHNVTNIQSLLSATGGALNMTKSS